jgi:hypothetical protein
MRYECADYDYDLLRDRLEDFYRVRPMPLTFVFQCWVHSY